MTRFCTFLFLLLLSFSVFGQSKTDSAVAASSADSVVQVADTIVKKALPLRTQRNQTTADTLALKPVLDSSWKQVVQFFAGRPLRELLYTAHPYFAFTATPFSATSDVKRFEGKEVIFYSLIGLLLLFAFLKTVFAKYINDLFRLFFRRTLKQRQITEQLSQTPLPSLVFNIFFMVTAGLYLSFIFRHYGMEQGRSFWLLSLYCSAGLGIMYLLKFFSLKITGWILNLSPVTDSYIFIVFIINKVLGIFLVPFIVLLAFTDNGIYQVTITLSWIIITGLYVYRFILSYSAVHNQIKVKPFHFLLYLIAFEIVPLLLIYKLLFHFLA